MYHLARRVRAVLVMALLWASSWAVVGALLGLSTWFRRPIGASTPFSFITWIAASALPFAVLGALCGAGFAVLLSRAERDHTVDTLVRVRIAMWGVVAGGISFLLYAAVKGALPNLMSNMGFLLVNLGIVAGLGGLSSYGSLAMARRVQLPTSRDRPEIAAT